MTARAEGRRADLLAKLQRAAQTSTTDGILFHQAIADRVCLHVTGLRCLNLLAQVPERLATIAPHYQGMATAWSDLLAAYSDEQLALFLDLFDRMHQLSQQQLASLPHHTPREA